MTSQKDYVLLVNAKSEKGFDLIIDVAKLCTDVAFLAIASQSERAAAERLVRERGLHNVVLVDRVEDMRPLYAAAKIVAVPSYKFVETFSRVCIEAHRYGLPVIGSNVGNVPYLLARSGVVLPEDAKRWAAEIQRIFGDSAYYDALCQLALENSKRYSYSAQRDGILSVLSASTDPLLVGIGSGIGNMLHVGPMIRHISQACGRRIDLVVAEDHQESLFLLHNDNFVRSVSSLRPPILRRRYEMVFLTHSFGEAKVSFNAGQVVQSRAWELFTPDHRFHETEFNLASAQATLGYEYSPLHLSGHYVGNIEYVWPGGNLVGFHGGSKAGFWASKRWPYFEQLGAILRGLGYRTASFGTTGEFVEGTEDYTGGTIEAMARAMCQCAYFVSNDSGVMNIASALGIPLVSIFGPTNPRTRAPRNPHSRYVAVEKECAPCECKNKELFLSGGCGCIADIPLSAVLEEFQNVVAEFAKCSVNDAITMRRSEA